MLAQAMEPIDETTLPSHLEQIVLAEMKTAKSLIKDAGLSGSFFGVNQREYNLAAKLGDRFRFAFTVNLTLQALEHRVRFNRVQSQFNLWNSKT